jgi:undecaprenyl-diphosphatase
LLSIFTILEGIPVLGIIIPGHVAILTAGFLARVGTLNLWWVIVISITGAILGDCMGFYIGRRYGITFIDRLRPFFFITDMHMGKARALLDKHTGKAMVIGRFTPATRSLMPFLVGTMHTPAKRFWFFNVIGAVCWAVSSVGIGYVFGAGYHLATGYLGKFIIIAIIATAVIIWGYRFVNEHFHAFKRYELFTVALNIFSLLAFAVVIDRLTAQSFKLGLDVWVSDFMCNLVHPAGACYGFITPDSPLSTAGFFIAGAGYWITTLGDTKVLTALALIIFAFLLFKKKWRSAAIIFFSIGLTGISLLFLKQLLNIARPELALQTIVNDPSFPSGHAGIAAAFFIIAAYLLAPRISSWVRRELMIVACVAVIILIGVSRLVLNVHWTSDVLAGWSLGAFMATSSILLVRYASAILIKRTS